MKRTKRIFAIFMTMALAMSMLIVSSAVSFAEDPTYTVTVGKDATDKANHTYAAYQIFTGKLETKDGAKVLSDIQWGDNIDSAKLITELKKINDFSSLDANASANDVAKAISDKSYAFDSDGARLWQMLSMRQSKGTKKALLRLRQLKAIIKESMLSTGSQQAIISSRIKQLLPERVLRQDLSFR